MRQTRRLAQSRRGLAGTFRCLLPNGQDGKHHAGPVPSRWRRVATPAGIGPAICAPSMAIGPLTGSMV